MTQARGLLLLNISRHVGTMWPEDGNRAHHGFGNIFLRRGDASEALRHLACFVWLLQRGSLNAPPSTSLIIDLSLPPTPLASRYCTVPLCWSVPTSLILREEYEVLVQSFICHSSNSSRVVF